MNIPLLSLLLSQIDGFIHAILVMVTLTLLFPALGANDDPLWLNIVTIVDASLVFSLHGATLPREKIVEDVRNWRLYLFIQSCTLILFPPISTVTLFACKPFIPAGLLLGVFYPYALPSAVSSSMAMTAMARGNVSATIFNVTISGLAGMVATPLLMSFVIQASGTDLSVGKALLGVARQLLPPFMLGQLLRPVLGGFTNKHKAVISKVGRAVILLIVLNSFADLTHVGVQSKYPWGTIVAVAVMSSVLLFVALGATTWLSRRADFNLADETIAVFCDLKKNLANSMPMGETLFAGNSAFGLIMLPLMTYHQLQPIMHSALAYKYADRMVRAEDSPATPASCVV